MRPSFRLVAILTTCLLLSGCGKITDLLRDESKAWRDDMNRQLEETRKMAKSAADTAIRAVPGERWLQIIDDLNGADEGRRAAAQSFLKDVARIDVGAKYEVSVWFEFDDKKSPMRADLFRAGSQSPDEVATYLQTGSDNLTRFTTTNITQRTGQMVRAQIRTKIDEALKGLVGDSSISDSIQMAGLEMRVNASLNWSDQKLHPRLLLTGNVPLNPGQAEERKKQLRSQIETQYLRPAEAERGRLANLLTDAVLAPYKDMPLPMGPQRLYKPWNPPLAADPFLFVLLKKEDWQKAKPKVFALIHKEGDSTQSFEKSRIYEFAPTQFIDGGKDSHGEEIVWAMHDMTSSGITSDMVASTKSLQELKRELAVQLTEYKGDQAQIVAHEEEASTLTLNQ
jgi:hypothetical protein